MKVAVVGCTHAGTSAILNILKTHSNAQITVYERNDTISFLSCGIALYVGGVVKDPQKLFYCSPEILNDKGVTTKMEHDVLDVDTKAKTLKIKNLKTDEIIIDTYDKLVVTLGSWPITPKIPGIELENILLSKNFYHSNEIVEKTSSTKNVVVVGAGYIGVELAEAFSQVGKNVTLIDSLDRMLSRYLDEEITKIAEKSFLDHNIKLELSQTVQKFEGIDGKVTKVITDKGEYPADMVIMCIGFRPNTQLFDGKLDMLPNGAIIVDDYMRTSDPDILAAGDCCSVIYNPTGKHEYIPLATNAIRMGALVAKNLVEPKIKYQGTQGTSGIKINEYNIASTGLTEEAAKEREMDVLVSTVIENYRPEFMPTYEEILIKLVYTKSDRRLVGAQICSKEDFTQSINTLSVCIQNKMTIDELAFVDFFFQPHFNKPWNYLNTAALNAL